MNGLNQKIFKELFSNLCCSKCKNDFDMDSLQIISNDKNTMICKLTCHLCGKDFGEVIFNYEPTRQEHNPMEIIDGPPPINSDDVINAHRFIKRMK